MIAEVAAGFTLLVLAPLIAAASDDGKGGRDDRDSDDSDSHSRSRSGDHDRNQDNSTPDYSAGF